ncbi:MAG: hypothetical protein U1E65_12930 [Myxococcota bacterium]
MSATKRSVVLDFVIYAGDPDDGAEGVPSERAVKDFSKYGDKLGLKDVAYGAILIEKDGKRLAELKPDPIFQLITKLVRTISFVLDGEPDNCLFMESDYGFTFEKANEDVLLSFFRGSDPFEPEEFLVQNLVVSIDDFAAQFIEMGDHMLELKKIADPGGYDDDEEAKGLIEFLDVGKGAYRTWRLEKERGRRR